MKQELFLRDVWNVPAATKTVTETDLPGRCITADEILITTPPGNSECEIYSSSPPQTPICLGISPPPPKVQPHGAAGLFFCAAGRVDRIRQNTNWWGILYQRDCYCQSGHVGKLDQVSTPKSLGWFRAKTTGSWKSTRGGGFQPPSCGRMPQPRRQAILCRSS